MQHLIEEHWYKKPIWWLSILLLPLSYVFWLISKIRYYCYQFNLFKCNKSKLSVPVVIVGNISVGGVGKTPFTKYLVQELAKHKIKAGVILRGYKGNAKTAMCVDRHSNSNQVGDEALIYAAHNIPVAIGRNRYLAGIELLKHHPNLQIIISDDGLQHYGLMRDYEIAVLDLSRICNNLHVLPMGALREPITRLKRVNAIVLSGKYDQLQQMYAYGDYFKKMPIAKQTLELEIIYNPVTQQIKQPDFFVQKPTVAIAATGHPQRFFNYIHDNLKINTIKNIAYPDHHYYTKKDILDNADGIDAILITEKDYVKIAQLKLNNDKIWVVFVIVVLDNQQVVDDIVKLVQ